MEKKTIGRFIAVLRRANGMTQRELGERLFVSDKTVSRWECDECTPELSLIPAIAEIFGVTADELLRGERINTERVASDDEDYAQKQRAKTDKQFRLMLDRANRKYKNLTLISIGIAILGMIVAMIVNLGFSKGLIAFWLAAAFLVASEICQVCFAINARIIPDEDDEVYLARVNEMNTAVVKGAVTVSFINALLFAFCLPLVTLIDGANYGLRFNSWLLSGVLYCAIAFLICYAIYIIFVHGSLLKKGLLVLSQDAELAIRTNRRLLIKTVSIALCVALFLGVCIFVMNQIGWRGFVREYKFETCEDFKAFMEQDYKNWLTEGYSRKDGNGDIVIDIPTGHVRTDAEIRNADGKVICEYYYNPDLYHSITFKYDAYDKMPVTVVKKRDRANAADVFYTVESALYALIACDFVVAAAVHLVGLYKNKNYIERKKEKV